MRLVPRLAEPEPDYMPQTYSDQLLQAWELRYGQTEQTREEGRDLLRKLCQDKYHLKTNSKT